VGGHDAEDVTGGYGHDLENAVRVGATRAVEGRRPDDPSVACCK